MKGDSSLFPSPQSALPLPPRPSLEFYKKLAKNLVKACKAGSVRQWVKRWIGGSPFQTIAEVETFALRTLSQHCTVTNAQFVIARSYGFDSWPKFATHLEGLANDSRVSRFEEAASVIVTGDLARLHRLLLEDPDLTQLSSTRAHGATLLHYVAANGVEDFRQKTPRNIVAIAETLLDAGAEVDAMANVYGGGCTALGLAATSIHPVRAGVWEDLLQLLVDRGANLELASVTSCLANGRPTGAEFLASRGARVDLTGAAGIGRLDLVRAMFDQAGAEQRKNGFAYACEYGRNDVVEFMLQNDPSLVQETDSHGQTGLHMASIGGRLDTVKLLLRHHPPLEAVNMYGGTVWGQTLWSAAHGGDPDTYIAILESLLAAGANVDEFHTPVNERIDAWLAVHGSHAEASWHWYGENPVKEP